MTRRFSICLCIAPLLALALPSVAQQPVSDGDAPNYEEVAPGEVDPLSLPVTDGVVWYGTWEDAMAEKERTGKPVMLHMGSPRCASNGVKVPGTW